MLRRLSYLLIVIYALSLPAECLAKVSFSRKEKVHLNARHNILKKRTYLTKRSSLKSFLAKLKRRNKFVKKERMKKGI